MRGIYLDTSDGRARFNTELDDVIHLDTSTTKDNVETILVLLESWLCLLADSPLNIKCNSLKPRCVFSDFRKKFLSGPLKEFILMNARIGHDLVSDGRAETAGSITRTWNPIFVKTPIFREYHYWFRTGDSDVLQYIYTFLNFGKRLSYIDDELHAVAFRDWLGVEEKLSGLTLDGALTAGLKLVVSALVPDLDVTELSPQFGPGAVAEKGVRGKISKANHLQFDAKIDRVLFRSVYQNFGYDSLSPVKHPGQTGRQKDWILPDPTTWRSASGASVRISELRQVEKDMGKSRSMCMEPNVYMFAQQALLKSFLVTFERSPIRRFVKLSDQSRNRDLAQYGSRTQKLDTIDLSSASDSVSVDLVRLLFPRKVLYHLLGTRTPSVHTTAGTIDVKKFAPMGSALCFPVQCSIFTAVVVYAAMQRAHGLAVGGIVPHDSRWLSDVGRSVEILFRRTIRSRARSRFSCEPAAVFGDDICVDTKLTPYVIHLLTSLGFSVNIKKSFMGSQLFRESCGGYYYGGDDVTPLYFRVKRYRGTMNPETVASMIAQANHAGDRGYFTLRSHLIHCLLYGPIRGIPKFMGMNSIGFTNDRTQGYAIFSSRPRNTHLRRRYSPDIQGQPFYQRDEHQCIMQVADKRIDARPFEKDALERYLYLQWWNSRSSLVNSEMPFGGTRFDTSGTRLVRKWIPALES